MAERTHLAFTVHPGEPLRVTVVGPDGTKFESKLRLAVLEVVDTGARLPNDDRIPALEFQAQLLAETRILQP